MASEDSRQNNILVFFFLELRHWLGASFFQVSENRTLVKIGGAFPFMGDPGPFFWVVMST